MNVSIQYAEAVGVTIRRNAEMIAPADHAVAHLVQVLFVRLRTMAAEINIAPVMQHHHFAADVGQRFVQVAAPRAPQRVIHDAQAGAGNRPKIYLRPQVAEVIVNQRQALNGSRPCARDIFAFAEPLYLTLDGAGHFGQRRRAVGG
jgi:hypothetical protein